jgi:imidazolonepropionase-like amidohydrolase
MRTYDRRSLATGAIALGLTALLAGACGTDAPQDMQIFRGARLIDGDGTVLAEQGIVVVRDGRIVVAGDIAEVRPPTGGDVVDLSGRALMPGLVNAHGHVADTQGLATGPEFYTEANLVRQLRQYARYGVTSVMSLGGDGDAGFALRDASVGPLDRARVFVAGPVITATTPDEARQDVRALAARRPDFVKFRVDDNLGTTAKMPLDVARAIVDEAHAQGLRAAAHIFYLDDAKALLEAGIDLIAHSVRDRPVDDEVIALFRERGVCLSPTLTRELSTFVYESEPVFFADPFFAGAADPAVLDELRAPERQARMAESASAQRYKAALEVAKANLATLADAGVSVAFGTDTGPPARFQGYFEHLELELMTEAGLSPAAALEAATGGAASCLGLTDVGFLREGAWADFLVLTADPLTDVRATRSIDSVWIGGQRIER